MRFNGTGQGDYTSEARNIAQGAFLASADTSPEPVSQNQVVNSVFHPPEFTAQAEPGPQGAILRGPQVVSCVRSRIKRSWSDSGAWVQSVGRVEEGARPPVNLFPGNPGLL